MKNFEALQFDLNKCIKEINDLKTLLNTKRELSEKNDILPFFKQRKHLSAIGSFNPNISLYDKIAYEFDIWGDFKTDVAVGDSQFKAYCFIEFEDAKQNSVFKKVGNKSTTEWSHRFEHGLSQLVDWFYKLEDQRATRGFRTKFGGEASVGWVERQRNPPFL